MSENKLPHDHGQKIEQQTEEMPSVDNFQTVAEIFKQLGDGSRIRIFWLLCHCEECVINLSALVEMSSPAISHHLRQLKAAGLIVSRREGKEVYYKAAETNRAQLLHHMIEDLVQIACPSAPEKEIPCHNGGQAELIRSIHDRLTQNPGQRFTIEELSREYLINTSTLKSVFKAVYGQPIAAYMKEFRMHRAMELLRGTDMPISDIAAAVGYESAGKFTKAFQDVAHVLPSEYRKQFLRGEIR